jgi:hypothetical protein
MSVAQETPFSEGNIRKHKGYVRAYSRLATAASTPDELVTYPEIGRFYGIEKPGSHMSRVVGIVLGLITEEERRAGRPMLSAVVVSVTTQRPGPGFYVLASQFGLLSGEASEGEMQEFWKAELNRVREAWKD